MNLIEYINSIQKKILRRSPKVPPALVNKLINDAYPGLMAQYAAQSLPPKSVFNNPASNAPAGGVTIQFDGNIQAWLSVPCNVRALNMVLTGKAVIVPVGEWRKT